MVQVTEIDVNYCFRCGRRVGPSQLKCLYCEAPTLREIRPPRRCPYCDQPVRPKALKCHHCGEFVDGRPKEEAEVESKPQQQQPTFIIEQAVIQTDQNLGLPQPGQAPMDGSRALEDATGRRIGAPAQRIEADAGKPTARPEQPPPEQPPVVQALPPAPSRPDEPVEITPEPPAPDTKDIVVIEQPPDSDEDTVSGKELAVTGDRELAPTGLKAWTQSKELAIAKKVATNVGLPALRKAGALVPYMAKKIKQGMEARKQARAAAKDALDIDAQADLYRICGVCGSEIFKLDSFCFHCGQKYAKGEGGIQPLKQKNNLLLYIAIGLLLAAHAMLDGWLGGKVAESAVEPIRWGTAIMAPLLAVMALARKPGIGGRIFALLVLIASAYIVYKY